MSRLKPNGRITCRAFWFRLLLLPELDLAFRAAYTPFVTQSIAAGLGSLLCTHPVIPGIVLKFAQT